MLYATFVRWYKSVDWAMVTFAIMVILFLGIIVGSAMTCSLVRGPDGVLRQEWNHCPE